MITEKDLQEAIQACQGVKNPSVQTCIKLAAFYTIKEHMYGNAPEDDGYSFSSDEKYIQYESESEFGRLIHGRNADEIWAVMDEAMEALQVLNPRLHANIIRRIGR